MSATFLVMAALAAAGTLLALRLWPACEEAALLHVHPDLLLDHPHLREYGTAPHRHPALRDALHPLWPPEGSRHGA
jgi:hypothetical protein